MTTIEKDIQDKIAEDMWHRDECFAVFFSTKGAGVNMFMRDGTVFRVNIVKVGGNTDGTGFQVAIPNNEVD